MITAPLRVDELLRGDADGGEQLIDDAAGIQQRLPRVGAQTKSSSTSASP